MFHNNFDLQDIKSYKKGIMNVSLDEADDGSSGSTQRDNQMNLE